MLRGVLSRDAHANIADTCKQAGSVLYNDMAGGVRGRDI